MEAVKEEFGVISLPWIQSTETIVKRLLNILFGSAAGSLNDITTNIDEALTLLKIKQKLKVEEQSYETEIRKFFSELNLIFVRIMQKYTLRHKVRNHSVSS